jgi:hypothetical protein
VDPFALTGPLVLTITQSGTRLLLKLNDEGGSKMSEIYGPHISTKAPIRPGTPLVDVSSGNTAAILFHAAFNRRTQPDRLVGELNFINRQPCGNLAFAASCDRQGGRIDGQ